MGLCVCLSVRLTTTVGGGYRVVWQVGGGGAIARRFVTSIQNVYRFIQVPNVIAACGVSKKARSSS